MMVYYFLPDPGIFGGVKVACQFVSMLLSAGVRAVVALPEGKAPRWFSAAAPVVTHQVALDNVTSSDWIMITWPPDYEWLKQFPGRLVCHCQGTDDRMHPIFADTSVPLLTCWKQAQEYVRLQYDRETVDVGIAISDDFFFDGSRKEDNRIAYMPRRGYSIARDCMRKVGSQDFIPVDGLHEREAARCLKSSGIFLATAVGEQFGLPALEAMAAGCVVLSVPVKGGMEYLHDGFNCFVVSVEEMPKKLDWLIRRENAATRGVMRLRAVAAAQRYRMVVQRRHLERLLQDELVWLKQ